MKALKIESWSERQQVIAIIVVAGLAIAVLWYFLLYPQHKRRRMLENDIDSIRSQLERSNYLLGEDVLNKKKLAAQEQNAKLVDEWKSLSAQVAMIPQEQLSAVKNAGHIEYKMALFDVRQRLGQKAAEAGVSLPPGLGLADTLAKDEVARTRMLQLRALEKLVDLLLDIQIVMLRSVEPLPPVVHTFGAANTPYMEEYPVHIEFYGSLKNLYDLFHASLEPEHVFALRRILVGAASANNSDLLTVRVVMSAMVFLEDPAELEVQVERPTVYAAPMGH